MGAMGSRKPEPGGLGLLLLATRKGDSKEVLDHKCAFPMSPKLTCIREHILNGIQAVLCLQISLGHILKFHLLNFI